MAPKFAVGLLVALIVAAVCVPGRAAAQAGPGVTITPSGGTTAVDEANIFVTDSYTIQLDTPPTEMVTITITADADTRVSTDNASWAESTQLFFVDLSSQILYVQAVDDAIDELSPHVSTITHTAASGDADYDGIAIGDVSVQVSDNDTVPAAVILTPTTVSATEGGATGSYSMVLSSQPASDVTVSFTTGSQVQSISDVTFTPANWDQARTITVTPVDDGTDEGAHAGTIQHSVASADTRYDGLAVTDVTVNITDNDANAPPAAAITNGQCSSTNMASGTLNLTLADPDGDTLALALLSNSNPTLVPNSGIALGGSGNNRTLTVTAAAKRSGSTTITLNVSDGTVSVPLIVTVMVGSSADETLNGTTGADMMFGLAGRNTLNGNAGNDLLCGGNSNDTLNGGAGNDILDGGKGDDALDGGADSDILRGGTGNDTLTGRAGADAFSGGAGGDVATDYTPGQGDTRDATIP